MIRPPQLKGRIDPLVTFRANSFPKVDCRLYTVTHLIISLPWGKPSGHTASSPAY